MTAEIIVINKGAIALAADSAVTFYSNNEYKIKNANKLFTLSKYQPVGLMVYGNAEFMGTPWEIIIKQFRETLGIIEKDSFEEYVQLFLKFLTDYEKMIPERQMNVFLNQRVINYYSMMLQLILERIHTEINSKCNIQKGRTFITSSEIKQIILETINSHLDLWSKSKDSASVKMDFQEKFFNTYNDAIDEQIDICFEKLPLTKPNRIKLKKIASLLFTKEMLPGDKSGIVIAGYGKNDIYPTFHQLELHGVLQGNLQYIVKEIGSILTNGDAGVIAFAQKEEVETFMSGISPIYDSILRSFITRITEEMPNVIFDRLESMINPGQIEKARAEIESIKGVKIARYLDVLDDYRNENYVQPILRIVTMLPKDELAVMAETLVSLTSFKKKVTVGAESVGGPIDVAVISKGDGFVWIKRKHYFAAELNPQFFNNYNRRVDNGKENNA